MRRTAAQSRLLGVLGIVACVVTPGVAGVPLGAQPSATIREIRALPDDKLVEIEVESAEEFPVRAEIAVLRVGTEEFSLSRPPADGSLHRLIFLVPAARFGALPDGAPVRLQYGLGADREGRSLGTLDKRALKEPKR
jgi:hypothetical protein